MRALTLWPEWAWAVAHLGKDVENRGWAPPFWVLGQQIAIHAGRHVGGKPGARYYLAGTDAVREMAVRAGLDPGPLADWLNKLHRELCETTSVVVAVARVEAECARYAPSGWAVPGQHHWRLHDVVALPRPVPCRGAQGLWVIPREVEDAVVAQLGGVR
jgi:hypothetical protein